MEKFYCGVIVEEAFDDNRVVNGIKVNKVLITGHLDPKERWHMYDVTVTEKQIQIFSKHIIDDWYIHFWQEEHVKIDIIKELENLKYNDTESSLYREKLVDEVLSEINIIDQNKFFVKPKLQYIHKYSDISAFFALKETDIYYIKQNISELVVPSEEDFTVKSFDYLMYSLEFLNFKDMSIERQKNSLKHKAEMLSKKGTIDKVKEKSDVLMAVQTDEYWQGATISVFEKTRTDLRGLMSLLESESSKDFYTDFKDELLESEFASNSLESNDMQNYKKRVSAYLNEHKDDLSIYKLRHNKLLTKDEFSHLEDIFWNKLGTEKDYKHEFGDEPLQKMVLKIVGLEQNAVNEIFLKFLSDESLNTKQMDFVKLIVNYIVKNGYLDKNELSRPSFSDFGDISVLFTDKTEIQIRIKNEIDKVNARMIV